MPIMLIYKKRLCTYLISEISPQEKRENVILVRFEETDTAKSHQSKKNDTFSIVLKYLTDMAGYRVVLNLENKINALYQAFYIPKCLKIYG